jgi:hypothetical protein
LTRELYGSSMMNAALAFKERQPNIDKALQAAAPAAMNESAAALQEPPTSIPKKQVTEISVGTKEHLPFPPETSSAVVPW